MNTPRRSVRVPDQLWHAAQQEAARRGETVTEVITRALTRYTRPPAPRQVNLRNNHVHIGAKP